MTDSDMEKLSEPASSSSNNQIPLVLGIIAVILAVIGIIIGAVSLSQNGTNNYTISSGPSGSSNGDIDFRGDDRIWSFAIGHEAAATEYLDEATGEIKGFDVDLVNAVCKIAGKNCVWAEDIYSRCWNAEGGKPQGGVGLWDGYYDGCTAWYNTFRRSRTFKFTKAFARGNSAAFIVLKNNPNSFDPTNLNGKNIGFVNGWVFDPWCINRKLAAYIQDGQIPQERVKVFEHRDEYVEALQNGDIDAGFDGHGPWESVDEVQVIDSPGDFSCYKAGRSIMTRKENSLAEWWDPAFDKLRASYEYRLICQDLKEQHGHIPGPTPEDICFGYTK